MSRDRTTCCANKKRTSVSKPAAPVQKVPLKVTQQKKRSVSPSNGPVAKRPNTEKVFPASALLGGGNAAPKQAMSNASTRPGGTSADLVCTPDILSMFMDDDVPSQAPGFQKTPPVRVAANSQPPPLTTIRQYSTAAHAMASNQFIRAPSFTTLQPSMPMVLNQQQVLQQVQPRAAGN